jgi:hypothetical protein
MRVISLSLTEAARNLILHIGNSNQSIDFSIFVPEYLKYGMNAIDPKRGTRRGCVVRAAATGGGLGCFRTKRIATRASGPPGLK